MSKFFLDMQEEIVKLFLLNFEFLLAQLSFFKQLLVSLAFVKLAVLRLKHYRILKLLDNLNDLNGELGEEQE